MRPPFSTLDTVIVGTALVSFAAFVVLHVLVIRYRQSVSSLKALKDVFVIGLALNLALGFLAVRFVPDVSGSGTGGTLLAGGATSVFIYGVLAFVFVIAVFNLGETARRIRLLRELYRSPTRNLTLDEILETYNADVILTLRLSRLVRSGQLTFDGHGYRIGGRFFLFQAQMLWFMRRLLRIPEDKF